MVEFLRGRTDKGGWVKAHALEVAKRPTRAARAVAEQQDAAALGYEAGNGVDGTVIGADSVVQNAKLVK